jgi:hypothetical protein
LESISEPEAGFRLGYTVQARCWKYADYKQYQHVGECGEMQIVVFALSG